MPLPPVQLPRAAAAPVLSGWGSGIAGSPCGCTPVGPRKEPTLKSRWVLPAHRPQRYKQSGLRSPRAEERKSSVALSDRVSHVPSSKHRTLALVSRALSSQRFASAQARAVCVILGLESRATFAHFADHAAPLWPLAAPSGCAQCPLRALNLSSSLNLGAFPGCLAPQDVPGSSCTTPAPVE